MSSWWTTIGTCWRTASPNAHAEPHEPTVVDDEVWAGKGASQRLEDLEDEFGEDVRQCVRKLRRVLVSPALLRRHRAARMPLAVDQRCFYWRDAGAPRLLKSCWRGPSIALMRENDDRGKPHTYWLAHATSLMRCARNTCDLPSRMRARTFRTPWRQPNRQQSKYEHVPPSSTLTFVRPHPPPLDIPNDAEDVAPDYKPDPSGPRTPAQAAPLQPPHPQQTPPGRPAAAQANRVSPNRRPYLHHHPGRPHHRP